jgi:hypothetical protein
MEWWSGGVMDWGISRVGEWGKGGDYDHDHDYDHECWETRYSITPSCHLS